MDISKYLPTQIMEFQISNAIKLFTTTLWNPKKKKNRHWLNSKGNSFSKAGKTTQKFYKIFEEEYLDFLEKE